MKPVSKRVRRDGKTYFQFTITDGDVTWESRYLVNGRFWGAIVSGLKAIEFESIDQLDSTIELLGWAFSFMHQEKLNGQKIGFKLGGARNERL
jgi:hypothetical protein